MYMTMVIWLNRRKFNSKLEGMRLMYIFVLIKQAILLIYILGIPQIVLLTKIDILDENLCSDLPMVFSSPKVESCLSKVSSILGIPENQIHPVKNYKKEMVIDKNVDILALMALRQMLYAAEDHLDNAQMTEALAMSMSEYEMTVSGTKGVQRKRAVDIESASEPI